MYNNTTDTQMSELEREFELEMDNNLEFETSKSGEDLEHEDYEFEDYENEEYEMEDSFEMEDYEGDSQQEFEWLESNDAGYGERFFELSQREFESESEVDQAVNELLTEMDNEYFFGGLLKKAKNAAMSLAQKGMSLAKKAGINIPSFGALKSMLSPLTGLLKGQLGSLIGPALKNRTCRTSGRTRAFTGVKRARF